MSLKVWHRGCPRLTCVELHPFHTLLSRFTHAIDSPCSFPLVFYLLKELGCWSFPFISLATANQLVTGGTHGWEPDAAISDFCKVTDILSELNEDSRVSCHTRCFVFFSICEFYVPCCRRRLCWNPENTFPCFFVCFGLWLKL